MDARWISFGNAHLPPDRLIHADALVGAAAVTPGSLATVYLDPPFATGVLRRGAAGSYDDRTPAGLEGYLEWLRPCLAAARDLLLPTGSLFVHLDFRAVHYVKVDLDRLFGHGRLVNELIWCYSVGGKSPRAFGRKHDTILWYARGEDHAFYPEAVRIARKAGSHMKVERDEDGRLVQVKRDRKSGKVYRYPVEEGKVPEDYWTDIETLNRGDRERTGWPTQKPEALLERILRATTVAGDAVADLFAGSGTTAAVAQRLGRRFVCVDAAAAAIDVIAGRLARQGEALAAAGAIVPDVVLEGPSSPPG